MQGEEQKKLDVVTNDVLKRALAFTGKVGIIASEEEDAPVFNADAYKGPRVPGGEGKYEDVVANIGWKYVTVFDPLDGSSNVIVFSVFFFCVTTFHHKIMHLHVWMRGISNVADT